MNKKGIILSVAVIVGLAGFIAASGVASARGFNQTSARGNTAGTGIGREARQQVISQVLGISQQDLSSQLSSGKTMLSVLQEHGLTVEQFHQKVEEQMKTYLQDLVSQGKITQYQADQQLQIMEQRHANNQDCGLGLGNGRGLMRGYTQN